MAISRTMGSERDDNECKRFFRKDQDNWAEMRGEHVRLDFNRPRNGVMTAHGQRKYWMATSTCGVCDGKRVMA